MSERAVVIYWGPGLSGKSTNLAVVREVLSGRAAGGGVKVVQDLGGDSDRTLIELGGSGEERLRLELLAPPGQAHHRHLRREAFNEVEGVVFVVDSSAGAGAANLASLDELELFAAARHRELAELSLVFQYNKRDLRDALEVPRLDELVNPGGRPSFEAIATRGVGVLPSLNAVISELRENTRPIQGVGVRHLEGLDSVGVGRPQLRSARVEEEAVVGFHATPTNSKLQFGWARHLSSLAPGTKWLFALAMLVGALTWELIGLFLRLPGRGG